MTNDAAFAVHFSEIFVLSSAGHWFSPWLYHFNSIVTSQDRSVTLLQHYGFYCNH
jgi:hypothetical protein